jgi:hypothetical protein
MARGILIRAIIKNFMMEKVKPTKFEYNRIAAEIEKRFPTEDQVNYFVAF